MDRKKVKALIRQKLDAALSAACSSVPHSNKDKNYSPAQWWYDKSHSVRHTLSTSASLSYSNSTLTFTLTYDIH